MRRKILRVLGGLICLMTFSVTAVADTRTWTPPAQSGRVYVVIRHKKSFPPMKTKVSIQWGRWSKTGTFDAAAVRYSREGIVIRLDHKKHDSVPITVSTDGYIVDIYQGDPPRENPVWEYVNW